MHQIKLINDDQIIEGIIISITFPILAFFFKYKLKVNYINYISGPLFISWICRKVGVNLYNHFKKIYHIKSKTYYFTY